MSNCNSQSVTSPCSGNKVIDKIVDGNDIAHGDRFPGVETLSYLRVKGSVGNNMIKSIEFYLNGTVIGSTVLKELYSIESDRKNAAARVGVFNYDRWVIDDCVDSKDLSTADKAIVLSETGINLV